MKKPLVSVIVTTRNEEKNIRKCLDSIKNQTYPKIEIVVVDNHSSDKTKHIAGNFTKKVYDKGPERSTQRNYGVKKSLGKYILYLDADMVLTPRIVEECVETVADNPEVVGLYIPEKIVGKGFWIKVRNFERSFYDGTVVDCVRFIPRNTFEKINGFDPALTGPEDWDFDKRIRNLGKVKVIKSELLHNERNFDLTKYLEKKRYYSNSMECYIRKWGRNDTDIKKQLGAFYRLLGVFIEKGKWVRLISHLHLAFGMYYLRLRVALNFISRGIHEQNKNHLEN